MFVNLPKPDGTLLPVNPLHVGVVDDIPDRPNKCMVYVDGVAFRIQGTKEATLALLATTPVKAVPQTAPQAASQAAAGGVQDKGGNKGPDPEEEFPGL